MQRSFLLFSNAIHEKITRDHYAMSLNKFMEFFKLKDYDSMMQMDPPTETLLNEELEKRWQIFK